MDTIKGNDILDKKTHQIEGSYGDKVIKISSFSVPKNNNIVINIHGTFGSMNGGNNKYLNFAQSLQSENIANVILYESSRVNAENNTTESDRYKQKQAKFIGKTFTDELEDARRVIQDIINKSKELFGIDENELEITLNGNSLGGILSFYLTKEFPQIKTIVSVGTGLRLEIKDVPILDTFPNINELKEILQSYHGRYVSYYGTEDDVFTKQSFFDLINLVGSKEEEKSQIEMVGVDHTFGKIKGVESSLPYKQIFLGYTALIQMGIMISGGHNMIAKLDNTTQDFKSSVDSALLQKYGTADKENNDDLFFG